MKKNTQAPKSWTILDKQSDKDDGSQLKRQQGFNKQEDYLTVLYKMLNTGRNKTDQGNYMALTLLHTAGFICMCCMGVYISIVPSLCTYQDMRRSTLCGICSHSHHSRSALAGRGLVSHTQAPRSLPIQAYLSNTHTHTHPQ